MVKKVLVPLFFAVLGCFLCVFVFLGCKVSKTGSLIEEAVRNNDHDNLIKLEAPYYNENFIKRDLDSDIHYSVYEALNYEFQEEKDFKNKSSKKSNLHDSYYIILSNINFDPFKTKAVITDSLDTSYSFTSFFPSYFESEFDFHKLPFVSLSIFIDDLVLNNLTDIKSIKLEKYDFDNNPIGNDLISFDSSLPFTSAFFTNTKDFRLRYNEYVKNQFEYGEKEKLQEYYDSVFFPNYKYSKADPSYFSRITGAFPIAITTTVACVYVILIGILLYFMLFKKRENKAQTLKKIIDGQDKKEVTSKPQKDLKKITEEVYKEE